MTQTEDLYTTKDTTRVRESLLKEQQGKDLLTGLDIQKGKACLDHRHDQEQFVRGVLDRQSNAVLGKVENLWTRYLSYWYPYDLQTFLRQSADYLDLEVDRRYRHPHWQMKLRTRFNQLNAKQMQAVLKQLNLPEGKNLAERKKNFNKAVLDRSLGYNKLLEILERTKNEI